MNKTPKTLKFKSESEEADWWASKAGREYVKQKSAKSQSEEKTVRGSSLLTKMNRKSSVQIAIRLAREARREPRRHTPCD
jgi:hypothetical protein